jgi:trigger factor
MEIQNEDMNVQIKDLSSVKKLMTIEVSEKIVNRELDEAYRDMKKNANVKGFRKGKVPRSVLERLYGKEINENIRSQLVNESLQKAMVDSKLNTIGEPQIDIPDLKKDSSFTYTITVDVKPEIGTIDFKGLKLSKHEYIISDEMIDHQIKTHQKTMATTEPILEDRPLQLKDFAVIEYEGFKDGKSYELIPKTSAVRMELGKNELFPNFDEKLLGMSKDEERTFDYTFPENYSNVSLSSQVIQMKVILKEIRKKVYPEINDEFAKNLGNYQTLDELKKDVRENLKRLYDQEAEKELHESVFKQINEKAPFEVPDTWISYELEGIKNEIEQTFAQQNLEMKDTGFTDEFISKQYGDLAEIQARRHLILTHLIDQEKLTTTDDEVEAEFEKISQATQRSLEDVKGFYLKEENQQNLGLLKYTILERKALQMILDSNTIETVELSPEVDQKEKPKDNDSNT